MARAREDYSNCADFRHTKPKDATAQAKRRVDVELSSTLGRTDGIGCGLARWENEGGALSSAWIEDRRRRTGLADEEKRILQRLGAGVIAEWNHLPTGAQRALFRHATSGETLPDTVKLKERIARFLHARSAHKAVK